MCEVNALGPLGISGYHKSNYASLSPPNVQTQTNIQVDRHGLFALFISVLDPFDIVGFRFGVCFILN